MKAAALKLGGGAKTNLKERQTCQKVHDTVNRINQPHRFIRGSSRKSARSMDLGVLNPGLPFTKSLFTAGSPRPVSLVALTTTRLFVLRDGNLWLINCTLGVNCMTHSGAIAFIAKTM